MANNDSNNNFAMLAMVAIVAVVGVFGLVFMNSGNQGAVVLPSESGDSSNVAGEGFRTVKAESIGTAGGPGDLYDSKASCENNCPNDCAMHGEEWYCMEY
ncbi:MAG: hypothetical protein ACLFTH_01995 [Candidatus Woesearchaeota archaeon]